MTEPNEPESDAIDALDRRAADAVAALEGEVAATGVPDFEAPAGSRRRTPVLLAAAALIVVALVGGAVLLAGGGDEESTVAGQPELTHLVLDDPDAAGFEISAAFDGTQEPPRGVTADVTEPELTVQGPTDASDPWASTVVEYTLPDELTTVSGETVDIGVEGASYRADGPAPVLAWPDGDEVRLLSSSDLSREELVSVAAATVEAGVASGSALPGYDVLHAGTTSDVFPTVAEALTPPQGFEGVAYQETRIDTGDVRQLVVASTRGSDARWRTTTALAESVEPTTVRGHEARIGQFGFGEVTEVSWLEDDGTLVRVNAYGPFDDAQLRTILDSLVEIDGDAFAQLVDDHLLEPTTEAFEETGSSIDQETALEERPMGATTPTTGPPFLANVATEEGGLRIEARLTRRQDGTLSLQLEETGQSGGSGTDTDVHSVNTNTAVRLELGDGRIAVGGIIGPSSGNVSLRGGDGAELDPVSVNGPSTANIADSDHIVFLATVSAEVASEGLMAVAETPDGFEVTLPL